MPVLLALLVLAALADVAWWVWNDRQQAPNWLPAFIAPMHGPFAGDPQRNDAVLRFADISLRQFVPLALPGSRIRLRISNQYGEQPLHVGALQVAWRAATSGAEIRPGSNRPVLFAGLPSTVVEPGSVMVSDPVTMVDGLSADLAVSMFLPDPTPRVSFHLIGSRSSYRSQPGDHVGDGKFPVAAEDRSVYFLAGVDVEAPRDSVLWVAFGDSITDGAWHTVDFDASWPALWQQRLRQETRPGQAPIGVINAGVSGNQLLRDSYGPGGRARFARDVVDQPGVQGVVVLFGINDLVQAEADNLPATVQQLIAGLSELAARAHARGLKIVGATLTPLSGSAYGRPDVESARQQLNRWIRDSEIFDAVVDFDAAMRDPAEPLRIRPQWTSDGAHPSDAGYRVMADALVQTMAQARLIRR